jgi:predicted nuclease of predicted toxin-antitoxin system
LRFRELSFLADQNVPAVVVSWMRGAGWDVVSTRDIAFSRASDPAVLAHSVEMERVLLTFDTDFGDLVVRRRMEFVGVIIVRRQRRPTDTIDLLAFIADHEFGDLPFLATIAGAPPSVRVRIRR